MSVRISVALCTFNGQTYLPDQLSSLAAQTRLPDELIVRDDGSTDGTVAILRQFAKSAPFPVSFKISDKRSGPAKNFEKAITDCSGEVIALCDQDDLWFPQKLAVIEKAFSTHPDLGMFFSDADMCDADGMRLGYQLWHSVGLTGVLQRRLREGSAFEVILRQNVVTGATMAFASRFRSLVLPIDPLWMHDGWIALLIAVFAPVYADPNPLIRYRQHPAQTVGAARRTLYQQYLNARQMDRNIFAQQADLYQTALARLDCFSSGKGGLLLGSSCLSPEYLQRLVEKIRHCRTRSAIRLRQRARLIPSVTEFVSLRYHRFSLGWKSFAQDLFL